MSRTEHTVKVDLPVRTVYNQWTQFEDFPRFMEHVDEVRQTDDTHLHWKVTIAGVTREFDTEITEQEPDQRVAWTTRNGSEHAGVVTFHALDDVTTEVALRMDFDPEGFAEKAGDKLGVVSRQAKDDLESFKSFIEERGGVETGAWRGEVDRPT
jgi:uncharacterized membrane protein